MRIIAGKYRGMSLARFCGEEIRPTPDRVKESLFQILGPRMGGAVVLDLFCGSGALGMECLSRGAEKVYFNDLSKESLALLQKNLSRLKEGEKYFVSCRDFQSFLKCGEEKFSLIFCDPPYREDFLKAVLLLAEKRLQPGGLVIYESEREEEPPSGWRLMDKRTYGRVKIFFLERAE